MTVESPAWLVRFQADGQAGTLSLTPRHSSARTLLESLLAGGRTLDRMADLMDASGLTAGIELMGICLGRAGRGSRAGVLSSMLGYRRVQIYPWRSILAFCRVISRRDRS